ncbi:hypothetical protein Tco_1091203 [Tanacetum coccineum]|uniref:Uncharacterized protein n=1 Tax=Tanacetum coccineum TaxID=301880 RepID=A0ABQ5I7Q1_9ASTR
MQAWDNFFKIKHAQSEEAQELLSKLLQDLQSINEELAEFINHPSWNLPTSSYDDDDDDSSVEDLVPTPIESEELSDGECDMPLCDDSITFSNPLFDANDDSTNSDDESFSKKDTPMKNFKIFSNLFFDLDDEIVSTKVDQIDDEVFDSINSIPPGIDPFDAESDLLESMLNRDISIDSSPKIDSLLDEFAGELIFLDSIPPGIDKANSTIDAVEDIPVHVPNNLPKEKSPSSSHRGCKASKLFHHKSSMLIPADNIPILGVRQVHFYPP